MGGVAWTEEEDNLLKRCVEQYGEGKWHRVPLLAGLNRCRKSCRLRWLNYLRPNIKRGSFNAEEIELILKLHNLLGNRWSLIAGRLPGRTANDVKNYWNCHLSKRFGTQETDKKKKISIASEIVGSVPLIMSSSLIIRPQNFKHGEGSIVKKPTMTRQKDEHTLGIQSPVDSISHCERTIFLEAEPGIGNDISSLDLQYFEEARAMEDRKGSCKSDWEDLTFDIDLWSESL